ncbi:chemerin-like receptor 1 [Corythoichthys intestinalis]|uniref:chemerin-like receptor 1 n=1 Tax=Corythoichthys intestinalis TaxID=161448 RepID=UPI0025A663F8|nr:chemerin-like receptor 1 [Corythoichthys intestinalis]
MAAITAPSFAINRTTATEEDGSNDFSDYETELLSTTLENSLNIMSIVIYSLAFILGLLGNGLVIWVTGFMMKKTVNTVWFLNLAVADFLFTAFLPLSVVYIALKFHWPFGAFMCKLNTAVSTLNMYTSVYILMVISIDRCVAVVFPVWAQNHRRVKRASHVSLCVWVVALILSIPPFIFRDTGPATSGRDVTHCFNNYAFSDDDTPELNQLRLFRQKSLALTRFFLSFVIPFSIIVACYAVIIHRIRKNANLVGRSSRTFKIIAAIIIVFFLCWAPFHILVLVEVASHELRSVVLLKVVMIGSPIATSLAYINSCLNPFLYVFMGQDFKDKAFKSILRALENAFQEEDAHADSKTFELGQVSS